MQISEAGLALIRDFEGYHRKLADGRCTTYYCPAGVLTIGYGCTEGIKPGDIWTHDEAEAALRRELAKFERGVARAITRDMNQNQFDSFVSLAYNIGMGGKDSRGRTVPGFSTSSVARYFNAGDDARAAKAFELWVNGGGKFLPGLLIRRKREAALFLTPVEIEPEPAMPQAVTEAPIITAPVKEAVQSSRTVTGALVAGVGTVTAYADEAMRTLMDTAAQVSAWSPVQSLLTTAGVNIKGIGFSLAVGGLALVVGRRVSAAKQGKIG